MFKNITMFTVVMAMIAILFLGCGINHNHVSEETNIIKLTGNRDAGTIDEAVIQIGQGNYITARDILTVCLAVPDLKEATQDTIQFYLGFVNYLTKDFVVADSFFANIQENGNWSRGEILFNRALALIAQGNTSEGRKFWLETSKENGAMCLPFTRGLWFIEEGRNQEAEANFKEVVAQCSEFQVQAKLYLGIIRSRNAETSQDSIQRDSILSTLDNAKTFDDSLSIVNEVSVIKLYNDPTYYSDLFGYTTDEILNHPEPEMFQIRFFLNRCDSSEMNFLIEKSHNLANKHINNLNVWDLYTEVLEVASSFEKAKTDN